MTDLHAVTEIWNGVGWDCVCGYAWSVANDRCWSGLTETSGYGIILVDTAGPCVECGTPTRCMDVGFEVSVCSIGCLKRLLDGYDRANRTPPEGL